MNVSLLPDDSPILKNKVHNVFHTINSHWCMGRALDTVVSSAAANDTHSIEEKAAVIRGGVKKMECTCSVKCSACLFYNTYIMIQNLFIR